MTKRWRIANKYDSVLPNEPNFPLLAGHVHKHSQLLDESIDDYTRAIQRDPKMVEAYVNRGYVAERHAGRRSRRPRIFTPRLKLSSEQWHRPSRLGVQRSATAPLQRRAGPSRRRAEADGRIGRDASGAGDRLSSATSAGQRRAGIPRRAEVCAQRSAASAGAGRHALRHAPLPAIHRRVECGARSFAGRSADLCRNGARLRATWSVATRPCAMWKQPSRKAEISRRFCSTPATRC